MIAARAAHDASRVTEPASAGLVPLGNGLLESSDLPASSALAQASSHSKSKSSSDLEMARKTRRRSTPQLGASYDSAAAFAARGTAPELGSVSGANSPSGRLSRLNGKDTTNV